MTQSIAPNHTIGLNDAEIHSERKALRKRRQQALLLVLPLLAFIFFSFVAPITTMLYRSIYNPSVAHLIQHTSSTLNHWDGQSSPPPEALQAMALDLHELAQNRQAGTFAAAVNRHFSGATSIINRSARALRSENKNTVHVSGAQILTNTHPQWSDPAFWRAIREAGRAYSETNFLTALDLERNESGAIQARSSARIYIQLYAKTLYIAAAITLLCILLGYPLAYYMAHTSNNRANILLIFVLLPFWTSLLVRTTAWIALLQTNGVINSFLIWTGFISTPLEMLYTRFSTIIAMTHILLPFMVLPLYSVMRGIDGSYVRAALSMGSRPLGAFFKVYLPLSLPGLSAGTLLVFIISVGYYITPALVGGTDGQLISNLIAFHMQQSSNWGLAAALGALLLAVILLLYWVYDRLVGASNIRLG